MADRPTSEIVKLILDFYGYPSSPGLITVITRLIYSPPDDFRSALSKYLGPQITDEFVGSIADVARLNIEEEQAYYQDLQRRRSEAEYVGPDSQRLFKPIKLPKAKSSADSNPNLLLSSYLRNSSYQLSAKEAQAVAAQMILLQQNNPDAKLDDLFQKKILPQLEAKKAVSDAQNIVSGSAKILKEFNPKATGEELSFQTLTAELSRVLPPDEAARLAQNLRDNQNDYHAHEIAQYTPVTTLSPNQLLQNRVEAFGDSLSALSENHLTPAQFQAFSQNVDQINFSRLYQSYSQDPSAQQFHFNFPSLPEPIQNLLNQGASKLKSKAGKAATDAVKKVGENLAKKVGVEITKTTAKAATEAAAGTAIPIVGAVAVEILDRLASFIKKHSQEVRDAILGSAIFGSQAVGSAGAGIGGIIGSIASGISAALVAAVVAVFTPFLIILVSIPILLAFFLFIINNSAYIVPPGPSLMGLTDLTFAPGAGAGTPYPTGPGGAYPQCWPVYGNISQGPFCTTHPYPETHCYNKSNAIDISQNAGRAIYATHDGILSSNCGDVLFGNCVRITSPLGFTTLYAHMMSPTPFLNGTSITSGTQLGIVGCTGNCFGAHLHYAFYPKSQDIRGLVPNYSYPGSTTGCRAGP